MWTSAHSADLDLDILREVNEFGENSFRSFSAIFNVLRMHSIWHFVKSNSCELSEWLEVSCNVNGLRVLHMCTSINARRVAGSMTIRGVNANVRNTHICGNGIDRNCITSNFNGFSFHPCQMSESAHEKRNGGFNAHSPLTVKPV